MEKSKGTVESVRDGVIYVSGIETVKYGELITVKINDKSTASAMVLNLDANLVGGVLLDHQDSVSEGMEVETTGMQPGIEVSNAILGRTIDALGKVVDLGDDVKHEADSKFMNLDRIAPGVIERQDVYRPLQSGILSIDALIPVGRGQRQLIIGDRQTGKTAIAIDTIINQKDKDCICVYVSIGQKSSKLAQIVRKFKEADVLSNTVVVAASASEAAVRQYLAPLTGTAIAEYFAEQGKDVLVVYDDLTKHANAYRQMALLLERPSGREAYPGDIFYLHSKLLERSVQYSNDLGNGSITALPIIETQAGDVSAYIPTNVISITDGQIFLEQGLFNIGQRPAISVGISVSRVGGAAQTKSMKSVAGGLKLDLAQYRELAAFAQFGSDLDDATKAKLQRGAVNMELLKQDQYSPYSLLEMVALIYAGTKDVITDLPIDLVTSYITEVRKRLPESGLADKFDANAKIEGEFAEALEEFLLNVKAIVQNV